MQSSSSRSNSPAQVLLLQPAANNSHPKDQLKYQVEISQMMYTFGEVRHPLPHTTALIEHITRAQMTETLIQASLVAKRRGAKTFSHEDLIFLIRRDRIKVARLAAFLAWRKVRKVAHRNPASGGSSDPADLIGDDADDGLGAADDADLLLTTTTNSEPTKKRSNNQPSVKEPTTGRKKIKLAWNLCDQFDDLVDLMRDEDADDSDQEDQDDDDLDTPAGNNVSPNSQLNTSIMDDEDLEYKASSAARLHAADLLTRAMSHDEYIDYADCRQSSFTYKKPARFKEWLSVDKHTGMKLLPDLIDILGFVCYEMVRSITEQCLCVKQEMDAGARASNDSSSHSLVHTHTAHMGGHHNIPAMSALRQSLMERVGMDKDGLFSSPDERTAIEPMHVYEAYRRLQNDECALITTDILQEGDKVKPAVDTVRNHGKGVMNLFSGGHCRQSMTLL